MSNIIEYWSQLLNMIEEEGRQISRLGFDTWVKTIKPHSLEENHLILSVPMDINKDMIEKRYLSLICSAAAILSNKKIEVTVELEDVLENQTNYGAPQKVSFKGNEKFYSKTNLIKRFHFDNFIIGEGNRFACAAASAVASDPAKSYNPLFLYGDVGLGKTHLMHAVGNEVLEQNKEAKVLYITSEKFVNDVVNSIKDNTINQFREKYRTLDVLMIDDIQFIGGKERCQDEFFHTFNHLYQYEKQIIISSDRPPKDISRLDDRLRSRFEGGLTCDIKQPDFETRVAILRRKAQDEQVDIEEDMIAFIAERVKANIRELEGVLNKIVAYSCLTNKKITKDMLSDIISDITVSKTNRALSIDSIIYEISNYFDIDPKLLKSKSRKQTVVPIRQIAMYVIREVTDISLPKIGEGFGGRNHATVIYSIEKVEEEMKRDEAFKNQVGELVATIKNML